MVTRCFTIKRFEKLYKNLREKLTIIIILQSRNNIINIVNDQTDII